MLLPWVAVICWLVLAAVAALATWWRPRWAGAWVGGSVATAGWVYFEVVRATAPGRNVLMEILAGIGVTGVGVWTWIASAAHLFERNYPGNRAIQIFGALGLSAAGLVTGYFGPILTGGISFHSNHAADTEEASIRILDVRVYREIGRPGEAYQRAEEFWRRILLPTTSAVGAVTGFGIGWIVFRPRRNWATAGTSSSLAQS